MKGAAGGISLAAVVALVATNGERFVASLSAGWDVLLKVVGQTPLGLASFLLAWCVGVLLMGTLRRWWPEPASRDLMHLRMGVIELLSSGAAFLVCWLQVRTGMGVLLGVIAGLSTSLLYRALAATATALMLRYFTKAGD